VVEGIDMGGMEVVGLGMVDMMVSDMRVTIAGVVELVELNWELWFSGRGCGRGCLREVEVVEEDYLMKVVVVMESCLLDDPTRFVAYHQLGCNHQV